MEFLFVSAIVAAGILAIGIILLLMLVRAVVWLVLLPFKLVFGLLFGILFIPFWIAKTAFRIIGLAVFGPIAVVAALVVGAAIVLGLLATLILPLIPIAIVGLLLWFVIRSFTLPVSVA